MNFDQSLSGPRRNAGRFAGGASHEMTRLICVEPLDAAAGGSSRDSSGMLELWHLLRDHKLAIALFAVVGVAAAMLLSMLQTPMYEARTTLEVQSLNEGGVEPLPEAAPGGGYTPETYLQTQARILESATLRTRVNKKVAQEYHPGPRPADRFASVRSALRMPTPVLAGAGSLPAVEMRVRPYEHTRLIEIRAEAPDPAPGRAVRQHHEQRVHRVPHGGALERRAARHAVAHPATGEAQAQTDGTRRTSCKRTAAARGSFSRATRPTWSRRSWSSFSSNSRARRPSACRTSRPTRSLRRRRPTRCRRCWTTAAWAATRRRSRTCAGSLRSWGRR